PLPKGRWTRELNFLGWQPYGQAAKADLPPGARVRVALQWREPHDPEYFFRRGEQDLYRHPLAKLRLVVLRQRDPDGKDLPADEFQVVARSAGLPQRLENHRNASTYELILEFTTAKGGRHALRIERQAPSMWALLDDPLSGRELLGQIEGLA